MQKVKVHVFQPQRNNFDGAPSMFKGTQIFAFLYTAFISRNSNNIYKELPEVVEQDIEEVYVECGEIKFGLDS